MESDRYQRIIRLQYIIDDKRARLKKVTGDSIWDSKRRVELKTEIQNLEDTISLYL